MRISDWSSDVCSSDLVGLAEGHAGFVIGTDQDHRGLVAAQAGILGQAVAGDVETGGRRFGHGGNSDWLWLRRLGVVWHPVSAGRTADRKSTRLNSSH